MSLETTYGYGIRVDNIVGVTAERLSQLFELAPKFREAMINYMIAHGISEPVVNDYYRSVTYGLASLLKYIIREKEGILLCDCQNLDGETFLLYKPCYPWEMDNVDYSMSIEYLDGIYRKYIDQATGYCLRASDINFLSVENEY